MDLKNKIAIVTGGSKGIGYAIAEQLARQGAHPLLVARGEKDLQQAVAQIQEQVPQSRPSYFSADVSDITAVQQIIPFALQTYGRLDILVNNAGVYVLDYLANVNHEKLKQILDVDLAGVIFMTKEVLTVFEKQHSGMILDIGSTAALTVFDQNNAYVAAKFGHRAFSKMVEKEFPYVLVYRLHPSNTETEVRKETHSELEKQIREKSFFLPALEIGVESVKLLRGDYPDTFHEIIVRADQNTGKKIVEAVYESPFVFKAL